MTTAHLMNCVKMPVIQILLVLKEANLLIIVLMIVLIIQNVFVLLTIINLATAPMVLKGWDNLATVNIKNAAIFVLIINTLPSLPVISISVNVYLATVKNIKSVVILSFMFLPLFAVLKADPALPVPMIPELIINLVNAPLIPFGMRP